MNYWDTVDAAEQVLNNHGLQMAQSWGMAKYTTEGVAAMIQQAALDFLSTEFKGFPKELVVRDLSDREDELYPKWVEFAEKLYGINNHEAQETGWEMIMGGPYGDPGLTDFPKRGALHQSRTEEDSKQKQAFDIAKDGGATVFLSRIIYDQLSWSIRAKSLAAKAKRKDSLSGFEYKFPNPEMADDFRDALGIK